MPQLSEELTVHRETRIMYQLLGWTRLCYVLHLVKSMWATITPRMLKKNYNHCFGFSKNFSALVNDLKGGGTTSVLKT